MDSKLQRYTIESLRRFSSAINLEILEAAQDTYWDLRAMLAKVMPRDEWLACRPQHAHPDDYEFAVGLAAQQAAGLVEGFGLLPLVARPSLMEQRQCPN
jgi:hypothetical protein